MASEKKNLVAGPGAGAAPLSAIDYRRDWHYFLTGPLPAHQGVGIYWSMKALFNFILLLVLVIGGLYAYIHITEDYELLAQIKNTQDQLLVELDFFLEEMKMEWELLKQDVSDKKRSVGL